MGSLENTTGISVSTHRPASRFHLRAAEPRARTVCRQCALAGAVRNLPRSCPGGGKRSGVLNPRRRM